MTKEAVKETKKRDQAPPEAEGDRYHGYTPQQIELIEAARGEPPKVDKRPGKPGQHGLAKDDAEDEVGPPSPNEPPGSTTWEDLPVYKDPTDARINKPVNDERAKDDHKRK